MRAYYSTYTETSLIFESRHRKTWQVFEPQTRLPICMCINREESKRIENAMNARVTLDEIGEALEARGYAHMTNGRDIGALVDELESFRAASKKSAE